MRRRPNREIATATADRQKSSSPRAPAHPDAPAISCPRSPGLRRPSSIEMARLSDLKPPRRNARTHSEKQILQIADSIRQFGWSCPILTDENYQIIAGVGRWKAAKHLRLREVPVISIIGLSEAEKRALALADNKLAANSSWNRAVLAVELGELAHLLPECNLNLSITGFEPVEVDGLLGDFDRKPDPADQLPEICKEPVSRRGDLWQLAPHRLLCGDARADADLRKLMGRETAAMVITHPSYNNPASPIGKKEQIKDRQSVAASRKLFSRQFIQFLIEALSLAAKHSAGSSFHLVLVDWRHLREVLIAGEEVYSELKDLILWAIYGSELSIKLATDCRAILQSPWYRHVFPRMRISPSKNTETEIQTTLYGYRLATSIGGALTGRGGGLVIIDDPIKPQDALSDSKRESVNDWFANTLLSRLDDKRTSAIVVVMQRLHEDDITGKLLRGSDDWTVLKLPATAQQDEKIQIGEHRYHTRQVGDLLHAEREPQAALDYCVLNWAPTILRRSIYRPLSRPRAT
jgi:hypothetical protein